MLGAHGALMSHMARRLLSRKRWPAIDQRLEATTLETRDDRIRRRAYQIWEASGRPESQHQDHWFKAVAEIDAEAAPVMAGEAGASRTNDLEGPLTIGKVIPAAKAAPRRKREGKHA